MKRKRGLKLKTQAKIAKGQLELDPEEEDVGQGMGQEESDQDNPGTSTSPTTTSPGKKRRKKGSLNKNKQKEPLYHLVPWASSSEWEEVCGAFLGGNYEKLISEVRVWRERVPSLPVGVETTLYIVQALLKDQQLKSLSSTTKDTDGSQLLLTSIEKEHLRSLYSLAIVRFLNHVSQLASKELGSEGTIGPIPMFTLASHVSVPDWIVSLRHEVSHGLSLPSLQSLRLATGFIQQWLKDNYWVSLDDPKAGTKFLTWKSDEGDESSVIQERVSKLIAAYIAARVYRIRGYNEIRDPEVIGLLELQTIKSSIPTKRVIVVLKRKISEIISQWPTIALGVIGRELIPPSQFLGDFGSMFKIFEEDPLFEKWANLWNPIIKLIQDQETLPVLCTELGFAHTEAPQEDSKRLTGLWLARLLEKVEVNERSSSDSLFELLQEVLRVPNSWSQLFLDRLFELTEVEVGQERVEKLKELVGIWTDEEVSGKNVNKQKINGSSDSCAHGPFLLEDLIKLLSGPESELNEEIALPETSSEDSGKRVRVDRSNWNWSLDQRGEKFWRNVPLGGVIG